jgi:hypothetical protein
MTPNGPFHLYPFAGFNIEVQDLTRGFGSEDFHIQVPDGESIDQVSDDDGRLEHNRVLLEQETIGTTYGIIPDDAGFFLIQAGGICRFGLGGKNSLWSHDLGNGTSNVRLNGQAYGTIGHSLTGWIESYTGRESIDLVRYHENGGKPEVLKSLPYGVFAGMPEILFLPDGVVMTPEKWDLTDSTPAQFYDLEGQTRHHPIAHALSLLHRNGVTLVPGVFGSAPLDPSYGRYFPSQTKDTWGLFCWKGLPNQADKNLFLLNVTDTIQAVPVTCERYSLEPSYSLRFLLVNPVYNVFLAGARLNPRDDSVMIYLGRVRKDSSGKIYRAETFRVKYFPEVESPVFSRNGQVLLFASRMPNGTNLVFSRLDDLVADVNRRYPDAKFDLEELK